MAISVIVTTPVRGFPSAHHQMLPPSYSFDSYPLARTNCCMSPPDYSSHHPLHWLHTHTAATNQTHSISLGLPLSDGRVLSAFITLLAIATLRSHSVFPEFKSSLSCFTCVLILAWFTSSCLISACPVAYSLSWIYPLPCCFGLCLHLAWTIFCLWIPRSPRPQD